MNQDNFHTNNSPGASRGLCNISRTSDLTTGIHSLSPIGCPKWEFLSFSFGA